MPTTRLTSLLCRLRTEAARLADDSSGVALIELAYTTPFLMMLTMGGIEIANYSITHMRVSQIAVSLADNSSRAKQEVVSGVPRMREVDVNEAFRAAQLQSTELDIENNGTLILSSLEVNEDGGQWIHWQRCFGGGGYTSSYGEEGDGETGTSITGIGPAGRQVAAEPGFAIMFAEVVYDYNPLMFGRFISDEPIRKTAAMFVRDDRDLEQLYNPSPQAIQNLCP